MIIIRDFSAIYLFYLSHWSSYCLVSIATKFLFVGFVEVIGCRHSLWNPKDLIYSDLKQVSKPSPRSSPNSTAVWENSFREPDLLRPAGQTSCYAQLHTDQKDSYLFNTFAVAVCKYKTPNRSDGLFYPLILYVTTRLCKLPNRSDRLFYLLTLNGLFTCCASYQIGQTDSSTLWHSTACSLCKIPNRSNDTRRLFCYAKHRMGQMTLDGSFAISKGLGGDHRHGLYTTKVSADVWSTHLVSLICRHHSDSCFKAVRRQGPVGMMIRL